LKKVLAIVLMTAVVFTLVACGGGNKPIKIAVTAPLTGPNAQYGESISNGAAMAIEKINAAGGIGGRMIEMVARDDRSDPNEAVGIANQVVNDKDILAVLGNFNSSCTLAASPIYDGRIFQISPASSSPMVTDSAAYRVITTDAYQAAVMAEWAKGQGLSRVAVIYEQTDFGIGLLDVFKSNCERIGGISVVAEEAFTAGQTTDFSTILTKIREVNPDTILIGGFYNDAAFIMQQAARLDIDVTFIGVDALYSEQLIEVGGESVEGLRLLGFFFPEGANTVAVQFAQEYEAKYGSRPDTYAAYAYDAMNLLILAMQANGANRDAFKPYMDSVADYPGTSGLITFDENGDVRTVPLSLVVRDGRFQIAD
jgi:branched-chain amino acid transport system substrate-binding protein